MSDNPLKEWESATRKLKRASAKYAKWCNGDIALTGPEHDALNTERNDLIRSLPKLCPHDQVVVARGTYTDVGYGCDRYYTHYDLYCNRCGKLIHDRTCDSNRRAITQPMPLQDAVIEYIKHEHLSEDELRKFGIRRQETVTRKVEYVRT